MIAQELKPLDEIPGTSRANGRSFSTAAAGVLRFCTQAESRK